MLFSIRKYSYILIPLPLLLMNLLITSCADSGGEGPPESLVVGADVAYDSWPNDTTTDKNSSEIVSKVLITDLNADDEHENTFISVLPNSNNPESGILRVTTGSDFIEVKNFKSTRVFLYKQSVPFAYDIDGNGLKELFFVSHDRFKVYSFGIKKNLNDVFVRWSGQLPRSLPEDFNPNFKLIDYKGDLALQIGDFGLIEQNPRKVKVVDMAATGDDDD